MQTGGRQYLSLCSLAGLLSRAGAPDDPPDVAPQGRLGQLGEEGLVGRRALLLHSRQVRPSQSDGDDRCGDCGLGLGVCGRA